MSEIQGWMTTDEMAWLARQAAVSRVIIELGTWKGRSTTVLCRHCPGTVYSVDHFMGSRGEPAGEGYTNEAKTPEGARRVRGEFLANVRTYLNAGRLFHLQGDTVQCAELLEPILLNRPADFVFIDACHDEDAVRRDIEAYWPLLRVGGTMAGHDYDPAWPGVPRAVDQLFAGKHTRPAGTIWSYVKDVPALPGENKEIYEMAHPVWCSGGRGETSKAFLRRLRTGWFDRWVKYDRPGLDIGSGSDPLCHTFRRYDKEHGDGDAQYLEGIPNNTFHTVYASHILEHVFDPGVSLVNWYRVLVNGGLLIVSVPHRDLYERKLDLPSRWNADHKTFWLPENHDPPVTRGLRQTIMESLPDAHILNLSVQQEGYFDPGVDQHAHGELSIEAVIQKPTEG